MMSGLRDLLLLSHVSWLPIITGFNSNRMWVRRISVDVIDYTLFTGGKLFNLTIHEYIILIYSSQGHQNMNRNLGA